VAEKQSRTNTHRSQNRRSGNHGPKHVQSNHANQSHQYTSVAKPQVKQSHEQSRQSRTYQSRLCVCL
jgi:hypothetical protein